MNKAQQVTLLSVTFCILFLLAATIIPMPQLITYERSNIVSKGIYWRGFGEAGQLLDAHASFVKVDKATNNLHVCHRFEHGEMCQHYRVIETQGLSAVIRHLL
ncbi:hypothetical protein KJY73_15370 [Bowmanella sp. Y26]|uniref:Uncharacterized protein n=1 Tax=Bowmanella yangjiangensis TaxID=2811230 RepID=A0ABS3D0E7_9ALTE|nr:hypothetical protein [Bowmanella yangjiangensis]MBN7822055.1 hypothetical protein [Bowmanella yangjiangensis]MBT1064970.1 hypothetical protein [Bowmanella yangjiangensis]